MPVLPFVLGRVLVLVAGGAATAVERPAHPAAPWQVIMIRSECAMPVPTAAQPEPARPSGPDLALVEALQRDSRVYVSSASIDGLACLRPCIVNFRTTEEDVQALVDVTVELGRSLVTPS